MVASWLSADTEQAQDTVTRVVPTSSLFRSLNLNRTRLPGSLTFRDILGPDKSVCEIVSRINTCVDTNLQLANEKTVDLIKPVTCTNDSRESWDVNSTTESTIPNLSAATSTSDQLFQFQQSSNNFSLCHYSPKLVEIYPGNQKPIFKRASLNAESLATIKKWESVKTFFTKIGDVSGAPSSLQHHKKIISSSLAPCSANPINSIVNKPLTSINNNNSNNNSTCTSAITGKQRKVEETLGYSINNSSNDRTQLNLECEEIPNDKLSEGLAEKTGKKVLSKEDDIDNPYQRISFSINNYFNSPRESPSVSPNKSEVSQELKSETHTTKKGIMKHGGLKRKSVGNIRGQPQIKSISTTHPIGKKEACDYCEILTQVDVKITSKEELSDDQQHNSNKEAEKAVSKISKHPKILKNGKQFDDVTATASKRKDAKMERLKNRFSAVLTGQLQTVAKPSQMIIPQNPRGRALFKRLANINEPHDTEMQTCNNYEKSHNKNSRKNQRDIVAKFPVWKPAGCTKHTLPNNSSSIMRNGQVSNSLPQKNLTAVKHVKIKDQKNQSVESNNSMHRSTTFITDSKTSLVITGQNESQENTEQSSATNNNSKSHNRHAKSLRMLREIISYEEENNSKDGSSEISNESFNKSFYNMENSEIMVNDAFIRTTLGNHKKIPKKHMKNVESQTSVKSDKSQSVQTTSQVIQLDASTEMPVALANNKENSMETYCVDVQMSNSLPTFAASNVKPIRYRGKTFRIIKTQTSSTSFQQIKDDRMDIAVDTANIQFECKQVNTEKQQLIDSTTGKDTLEIQNFCCDTQLTNTESHMFDSSSADELKIRVNNIESQVNASNSVVKMSTAISNDLNERTVSIHSNELTYVVKSSVKYENESRTCAVKQHAKIPDELIEAFQIAAKRAQNIHKAIEIYHDHEMRRQKELKSLTEECPREIEVVNLLKEHEQHSQSLIVALTQISESEKALQAGLLKLVLQQEIQITVNTLLDEVDELMKLDEQPKKSDTVIENTVSTNSQINCRKFWAQSEMSGVTILPIIYLSICSLIFWSLELSTSCDIG